MDYSTSYQNIAATAKALQRKVAVLGAKNVGKTTFTVRFVESRFVESYYPTIENHFTKLIRLKNHNFTLEILDTAGQDEVSLLNLKSLVGVKGIILCYNVVNRNSFDLIPIIWDKLVDQLGYDNIPVILVGNKIDLRLNADNRNIVAAEEGEKLANMICSSDKKLRAEFMECSAKDDINIEEAVMLLLKKMEAAEGSGGFDPNSSNKCNIM
ncbi:putative GTPase RHB1 NDAI_0G04930 [Naumovozyma dairenensis CBS 421]|uniref:GTP-binding protein n=1 Tax=Naumovozyma dairenensis (strain ATCC 10597 / BCRC 20456 / CBS 421 / NBRC 0211 / NRRL Y-12639) TaxID=1071378 RepID=J7S4I7_NAUDC|nr:hypothetical protein NDAI_0G04930 [Naumovozyma dairenensis CBS 421]CCK73476.1 hypothetical protein NDAI_0G04930 [Naumovozyma dairenensis CBS 421]